MGFFLERKIPDETRIRRPEPLAPVPLQALQLLFQGYSISQAARQSGVIAPPSTMGAITPNLPARATVTNPTS